MKEKLILIAAGLILTVLILPAHIKMCFTLADDYPDSAPIYMEVMHDGLLNGPVQLPFSYSDIDKDHAFGRISLRDFLTGNNDTVYRITDNCRIGGLMVRYGFLGLYEISAEDLYGHLQDAENVDLSEGFLTQVSEISGSGEEGISEAESRFRITEIRKHVLPGICVLWAGTFILIVTLLYILNRYVIRDGFMKLCAAERLERVPALKTVLFAIFLSFFVGKVFTILSLYAGIVEKEEICFLIIAGVFVWEALKKTGTKTGWRIGSMILILAVLSLSVIYMTSYLTVDERGAIAEQAELWNNDFWHFSMQNAHTNYLIMGTVFFLMPKGILEILDIDVYQFAKLLHWLAGFLVMHALILFSEDRLIRTEGKRKLLSITGLYATAFTLPVFCICLTNYNYDLFSVVFGIASLIVIWHAWEKTDAKEAVIALIFCTLALQEKILVYPLMMAESVLFTMILVKTGRKSPESPSAPAAELLAYAKGVLLSILTSCGVLLLTDWWVCSILMKGRYSGIWRSFLRPLIYVETDLLGKFSGFADSPQYLIDITALVFHFAILFLGVLLFSLIEKGVSCFNLEKPFCVIASAMLLFYFLMGIIFTYLPTEAFVKSDRIRYLIDHIVITVNAVPTVFLLAFMIFFFTRLLRPDVASFPLLILLFLSWGMTILYTIMGEYNSARYSNVYIVSFQMVATILLLVSAEWGELRKTTIYGIIAGMLLTLIEVIPGARFAYTIFYPYWNMMPKRQGYISDSAWGSLQSVYDRAIAEYCRESGTDIRSIRIYTDYGGRDFDDYHGIPVTLFRTLGETSVPEEKVEEMLTGDSFFCVEGNCVYNYPEKYLLGLEFPGAAEESLTEVTYRGIPVARIYSGEQMSELWKTD
ncbi:MAG: hypothetical protein K6F53_05030 [Lachnospiraceae bacterium]|nr:hypothetical protein [Lachnospiraceae bacterium]